MLNPLLLITVFNDDQVPIPFQHDIDTLELFWFFHLYDVNKISLDFALTIELLSHLI